MVPLYRSTMWTWFSISQSPVFIWSLCTGLLCGPGSTPPSPVFIWFLCTELDWFSTSQSPVFIWSLCTGLLCGPGSASHSHLCLFGHCVQDYYVADASEGQVMLCVVHNTSDTNLYISDVHGLHFSLSLERIVYFNPRGAHKDTWLR